MSELLFVCYPRCTTCKKALKWLDDNGLAYDLADIKADHPDEAALRSYHKTSGLPLKRFFNTSGIQYREMGLSQKLKDMSEDEQFALLATDGTDSRSHSSKASFFVSFFFTGWANST